MPNPRSEDLIALYDAIAERCRADAWSIDDAEMAHKLDDVADFYHANARNLRKITDTNSARESNDVI